jgi:hypothetical protein
MLSGFFFLQSYMLFIILRKEEGNKTEKAGVLNLVSMVLTNKEGCLTAEEEVLTKSVWCVTERDGVLTK